MFQYVAWAKVYRGIIEIASTLRSWSLWSDCSCECFGIKERSKRIAGWPRADSETDQLPVIRLLGNALIKLFAWVEHPAAMEKCRTVVPLLCPRPTNWENCGQYHWSPGPFKGNLRIMPHALFFPAWSLESGVCVGSQQTVFGSQCNCLQLGARVESLSG